MSESAVSPWRLVDEELRFANPWVEVREQRYELPDGSSYRYTRVDRPRQGVGIVLVDAQGRLLLEREYRPPVEQVIWQLPGGLIDPQESALESARRELREETGYSAREWQALGLFYDNPALGNAASHLFLALGPEANEGVEWDEAEAVELHWVTQEWLRGAVGRGEIVDRVVLAAIAMLWAAGRLEYPER